MPDRNDAPCIYPTFRYRNAAAMIDWLCNAFGFSVHARYGDGDDVHHAQLTLGSSMIMLGNVRDDAYGKMVGGPGPGGKSTYIAVADTDAVYARARQPAPRSSRSRSIATMAAAISSAPTRKAMSGRSAPTGRRPAIRRDLAARIDPPRAGPTIFSAPGRPSSGGRSSISGRAGRRARSRAQPAARVPVRIAWLTFDGWWMISPGLRATKPPSPLRHHGAAGQRHVKLFGHVVMVRIDDPRPEHQEPGGDLFVDEMAARSEQLHPAIVVHEVLAEIGDGVGLAPAKHRCAIRASDMTQLAAPASARSRRRDRDG